jgi:hypothetical protein
MALPISVTYTFATATSAIPLSQLDANFTTVVNGINGIGNGTNALSNVSITGGTIDGTTIGATTSSTGRFSTVTATTGNITTINATTTNSATVRADGNLTFQSNGTTTAMTIDTSQNVGIGTASPTRRLDVSAPSCSAALTSTTGTNAVNFNFNNTGGLFSVGIDNSTGTGFGAGAYGRVIYSGGAYPLVMYTNGSETMRIDSSGNVGIGTSSPVDLLTINRSSGSGITSGISLTTAAGASGDGSYIKWTGATTGEKVARIDGVQEGTDVGSIRFNTGNGADGFAERMRIDSSGNLLVGCTATVSASVKGVQLSTGSANGRISIASNTTGGSDMMYFYNPNGIVGAVGTTGSSTYYNTSSDYRLKEDVHLLKTGLSTVSQMRPVSYKWKVDGSIGNGFIAHELQALVPDAVSGEKDAVDEDGKPVHQGVDYSKIVVHLVAAIQELSAKVAALEAK